MLSYHVLISVLTAKELAARLWARDMGAVRARLGRVTPSTPGARIWLHAASNGELSSARPVITALLAQGRALLITVNTDSARRMAEQWSLADTDILLAPVDLPGPTRRVLRNWEVCAHITLESDLWPNRLLHTPGPVLVLGGRLTERTAKGWARFDALTRRMLRHVRYLSAQDSDSASRFDRAGLPRAALGPVFDLKTLYTPPGDRPPPDLAAAFPRADTWLAASTHPGEDEVILAAHAAALQQRPALRLILAPRHPKRAEDIASLIRAHGLSHARRSAGEDPSKAQVYLADTLGEMHLWYQCAGVTFVAGTLSDRGGHTPYEPAAYGSAILHGADTRNFQTAFARLRNANATRCTPDSASLAEALIMLASREAQTRLGHAGQIALSQTEGWDVLMRDITAALET